MPADEAQPLRLQTHHAAPQIGIDLPAADELTLLEIGKDPRQARGEKEGRFGEIGDLKGPSVRERSQDSPLLLGHAVLAQPRPEEAHDGLPGPQQRHRQRL